MMSPRPTELIFNSSRQQDSAQVCSAAPLWRLLVVVSPVVPLHPGSRLRLPRVVCSPALDPALAGRAKQTGERKQNSKNLHQRLFFPSHKPLGEQGVLFGGVSSAGQSSPTPRPLSLLRVFTDWREPKNWAYLRTKWPACICRGLNIVPKAQVLGA